MLWFYLLSLPFFRASNTARRPFNFSCVSDGDLLYANPGDNVTLPCFYTSSANHLSWYKQIAGEQPQIMSSFYKHSSHSNVFYKQFKDNKRLSVQTGEGLYNLNIHDVQDSDSAMYYCGYTSVTMTEFDKGTFLVLKNSSCRTFLQQPDFDSVQLGGSVTLTCTTLTGTSEGEHTVYWFKKDSGASHMAVLYTNSQSSCEDVATSERASPAHRCVYSLSKRNAGLSDAGTYHCAVASCGHVLFGTGTTLSVGGNQCHSVLLYGAIAALVLSLILNVILISVICHGSRRKHTSSEGPHQQLENMAASESEERRVVHYAALDFKQRRDPSTRQRNMEEETIYSRVRC